MAVSVSFGSNWAYLTAHVEEGTERDRSVADNYYLKAADHGEPPGQWLGRGALELGLSGVVQRAQMEPLYGQLCHPDTGEALGTRPRSYADFPTRLAKLSAAEPDAGPERLAGLRLEAAKSGREARTYIDVTVSPEKSWSVLHTALEATGRHDEAEAVWAAVQAGGDAMVEYMAAEAGYSRSGYHGAKLAGRTSGRWTEGHDWTVSAWRHHTSRLGEPQLHIHYAVLNRVRNDDGQYRSLDGAAVVASRPAAEAVFHRVAEQALTRALGVRFVTRADGVARSIAGVDEEVSALFSSRRRAIKGELAELVAAYTETHGAAPKAYQVTLMAEHATLKTRPRKLTHPPSRAEMVSEWEQRTHQRLGKSMASVVDAVDRDRHQQRSAPVKSSYDPEAVVSQAMAQVDRSKAVWSRYDLIGQLDRYLPDEVRGLDAAAVSRTLNALADRALAGSGAVCLVAPAVVAAPAALRRGDGRSIYEPPGAERYATATLLDAEERLVLIARSKGGRRLDDVQVNRYLTTESTLSSEQANIARAIVTSERRIEVLVGPARAGKSRTVGEMAALWERSGGKVVGLAVAQTAAEVLKAEGLAQSTNLDAFAVIQERIKSGRASRRERANFALDARSLVVVDEASMVSTHQLAEVIEAAHRAGAKVLVTGDDLQLGAVGAGGAMGLLAREVGAHELAEVHRFDAPWEGAASLRLRQGDVSVLEVYDRHGRLVEGSQDEMKQAATAAFLTSYLNGRQTMVVTATNESAAEMSSLIRQQLVDLGRVEAHGVGLDDHTTAGVGDVIETRKNDATVADSSGRRVINRDTYVVTNVATSGDLRVRRRRDDGSLGPKMTLPASYVADNVELAYSSTAHAAEGRTIDDCYNVVDDKTSRAGLYVGLSRGKFANVAFVVVEADANEAAVPARIDRFGVLAGVLERDGAERSATEVAADERQASVSLARLGPIWSDCLVEEARLRYSAAVGGALRPDQRRALKRDDAAPALWRLVRRAEQSGHDPETLLAGAAGQRELDSADSIAQVLHHRIARIVDDVDQPSAARLRPTFTERTPSPEGLATVPADAYGLYARQLATVMDQRRSALGELAAAETPLWSAPLGPVPEEAYERAEWTERAATVAAYREQYSHHSSNDAIGAAPPRGGDPERREAWDQAWMALGRPERERDVARLGDGELANVVEAYRREEAWAPPYVADDLREAHLSARHWEHRAARDQELYPQAKATAGTQRLAEGARQRVAVLEEVDTARLAWYDHTAEARGRAERASAELRRRHPTPPMPQSPTAGAEPDVDAEVGVEAPEPDRVVEAEPDQRQPDERQPEQASPAKTNPWARAMARLRELRPGRSDRSAVADNNEGETRGPTASDRLLSRTQDRARSEAPSVTAQGLGAAGRPDGSTQASSASATTVGAPQATSDEALSRALVQARRAQLRLAAAGVEGRVGDVDDEHRLSEYERRRSQEAQGREVDGLSPDLDLSR